MQPIERYAFVTLLFLVVLVAVGALWDDGEPAAAAAPAGEIARAAEPVTRTAQPARRERPAARRLPLNTREPEAETSRAVTQRSASRATLGGDREASAAAGPRGGSTRSAGSGAGAGTASGNGAPSAPTADELASSFRPERASGSRGYDIPEAFATDARRRRSGMDTVSRPAAATAATSRAADVGPATLAPARPSGPETRDYTIRSGDSLERIARRELGDARAVDRIAALNQLSKPYTIYAGRKLKLPVTALAPASSTPAAAPAPVATEGRTSYTVLPGDSLSVVLQREYGTYKRSLPIVKSLNPGLDPNRIHPGTTIVMPRADEIPGGVSAPTVTAAPADIAQPRSKDFVVR